MASTREMSFRIAPHVQHTLVAGETVLLDGKRGKYLGLNQSATRIWLLVMAHETVAKVVEELQRAYGLAQDVAQRDVEAFIASLQSQDLVEPIDAGERG